MRVRTDGVQITWTPLNAPVPQEDHPQVDKGNLSNLSSPRQLLSLLALGGDMCRSLPNAGPEQDHSFVAAWRQETAEVDQQLRGRPGAIDQKLRVFSHR